MNAGEHLQRAAAGRTKVDELLKRLLTHPEQATEIQAEIAKEFRAIGDDIEAARLIRERVEAQQDEREKEIAAIAQEAKEIERQKGDLSPEALKEKLAALEMRTKRIGELERAADDALGEC